MLLVLRRFYLQPNIRERNPVVKRDPFCIWSAVITLCHWWSTNALLLQLSPPFCFVFTNTVIILTERDTRILWGTIFIFIYFNLMLSHSPFYSYSTLYIFLYCIFLPYFNSLYIVLLLCHSICFILRDTLHILILLSVIYFRYTTHSICISSNSEGSKKLPDDGRLLPKHVGAIT
jgi:hypothetical protein